MLNTNNEYIISFLHTLSNGPGVYQYFDKNGERIYIGKAKNLKKRVSSYFQKEHHSSKLNMLVRKIDKIEVIHVNNEIDALILENNLIKQYKPKYNVLLKDDKTYPWICISKEDYPQIFPTRNSNIAGAEYFGPYPSLRMMKILLELIQRIYPIRNCKTVFSEKNVIAGKYRSCLQYQIGRCLAPCVGEQSATEYQAMIDGIRSILRGHFKKSINELKTEMYKFSDNMEYEKAQLISEKLKLLENYQSKSMILNLNLGNVDVFGIISDENYAYINFLRIIEGSVIQGHTIELKKKIDESDEDMLMLAFGEFIRINGKFASEVIVPFEIETSLDGVKFIVPLRGDKKQLLDLSLRNARLEKLERQKRKELVDPDRHSKRIMTTLQKDLRLKTLPYHIECFDNSNFQGSFPVASCVVFKNARPSKNDYRHFNIKTVVGIDDFASMREIIHRRYKRLLDENSSLPDLIIVDGGKGQLSNAVESLKELNLYGKIAIVGVAKRLEEIFFPEDSFPVYIDKKSESLKLIQHLRDEAHRFGITFHRHKRDKNLIISELLNISGIGKTLTTKLLNEFGSVEGVRNANKEQLYNSVGKAKAELIIKYFSDKKLMSSDKNE